MPCPYPPEFRARAIALARDGRQVKQTALDLGIHEVALHTWLRQDGIDHGRRPGLSSRESAELRAARGLVRQIEEGIAILRWAATWLDEEGEVNPKKAPSDDRQTPRRRAPCMLAAAC